MFTPWLKMLGRDRSLREGPLGSSTSRGVAARGQPSPGEDDDDPAEPEQPRKDKAKGKDKSKAPPEDVRAGASGGDPRIKDLQRRFKNVEPERRKGQVGDGEEWAKQPHATAVDKFWI